MEAGLGELSVWGQPACGVPLEFLFCLNIVFLIAAIDYFEVVLTHTGPLVLFKSASQYDSIMCNSWK